MISLLQKEFATGKDHTHIVAEIEKELTGLPFQVSVLDVSEMVAKWLTRAHVKVCRVSYRHLSLGGRYLGGGYCGPQLT